MKMKMRCLSVESQQATEVIPARQPFYTLLGAKLSLCVTFSWGAVSDDCTGTKEQLCGSSPLLEASKGEEPHTYSIVPVQSSTTAPMSHKVTIWLPKEYKGAAWLGSPQLLVDSQHSNISHTFITFYKYVYICIFSWANSQLIYL